MVEVPPEEDGSMRSKKEVEEEVAGITRGVEQTMSPKSTGGIAHDEALRDELPDTHMAEVYASSGLIARLFVFRD